MHKLRKYLDDKKNEYAVISHSPAYTAQEIAQNAHISGKEMAKTVIVEMDREMAMVVLPASYKVNIGFGEDITGSEDVRLAREDEFKREFADCEIGAMPPLGNLYLMDVYVAKRLTEDKEIAFNAGNHRELIVMKYKDFERLVHPTVLDLTFEPPKF